MCPGKSHAGHCSKDQHFTMRDFEEQVAGILRSAMSRPEKARSLAQLVQARRLFHWVGLYDVSDTHISAIAWTGADAPAYPTFPITHGLNGAAVAERRAVVVQDVSKDARYLTTFGATKAEAIFPVLSADGTVVGTIDVESDRVNAFTSEDVTFLQKCALLLAPLWTGERGARA